MKNRGIQILVFAIFVGGAIVFTSLQARPGEAQTQGKQYQCVSSTSRRDGLRQMQNDANARGAHGWRMVNFVATGINPVTFHACYER